MTAKALITGATGFIGTRLTSRLLAAGYNVHALVRSTSGVTALPREVQVHRYDGSYDLIEQSIAVARPDIVFHLASAYIADHKPEQIEELVASNLHLPLQLAEAMTARGVARMINTGTLSQHFETMEYNPVSLYAATKQACTDLLRYFHEARGLSVITLKLSDTYGAGDTRKKLVQLLVDAAVSGEPIGLSPGHQMLDLTHVDDVVNAFIIAADLLRSSEQPVNEEYFISGERLTVKELVALIGETLGRPIQAKFGARPYRAREIMVPVSAPSQRLPGWLNEHRLREAVATLVSPSALRH